MLEYSCFLNPLAIVIFPDVDSADCVGVCIPEIICGPLPELIDGHVTPPTCTLGTSPFGTVCTMGCRHGYKMVGAYSKQCSHSGQWLPKNTKDNLCYGGR